MAWGLRRCWYTNVNSMEITLKNGLATLPHNMQGNENSKKVLMKHLLVSITSKQGNRFSMNEKEKHFVSAHPRGCPIQCLVSSLASTILVFHYRVLHSPSLSLVLAIVEFNPVSTCLYVCGSVWPLENQLRAMSMHEQMRSHTCQPVPLHLKSICWCMQASVGCKWMLCTHLHGSARDFCDMEHMLCIHDLQHMCISNLEPTSCICSQHRSYVTYPALKVSIHRLCIWGCHAWVHLLLQLWWGLEMLESQEV